MIRPGKFPGRRHDFENQQLTLKPVKKPEVISGVSLTAETLVEFPEIRNIRNFNQV